jgi:hypothetical protein
VEVDTAFVNGCWGFIKAAKVFSREKVTSVCVRGSRKTLIANRVGFLSNPVHLKIEVEPIYKIWLL